MAVEGVARPAGPFEASPLTSRPSLQAEPHVFDPCLSLAVVMPVCSLNRRLFLAVQLGEFLVYPALFSLFIRTSLARPPPHQDSLSLRSAHMWYSLRSYHVGQGERATAKAKLAKPEAVSSFTKATAA